MIVKRGKILSEFNKLVRLTWLNFVLIALGKYGMRPPDCSLAVHAVLASCL
jgi:hypothetical protein